MPSISAAAHLDSLTAVLLLQCLLLQASTGALFSFSFSYRMSFGFWVNESNFRTLSTGNPFIFAYFTIFNENIQSLYPTIFTSFALFYAALDCFRPGTM